ncbi:hypothetical protein GCM10009551_005290 [Nocardiopsis tropica]
MDRRLCPDGRDSIHTAHHHPFMNHHLTAFQQVKDIREVYTNGSAQECRPRPPDQGTHTPTAADPLVTAPRSPGEALPSRPCRPGGAPDQSRATPSTGGRCATRHRLTGK